MSKSKTKTVKKADVLDAVEAVPVIEISQPQVAETTVVKKLGRPAVPDSKRQMKIAEREAAIAAGNAPTRGRKPVEGSKRQIEMARKAELRAAGVLTGLRGRPTNPESKHAKAIAEKQARIADNGGVPMKPGRPKYTAEQKAAADAIKAAKKADEKAAKAAAIAAAVTTA